MSSFLPRAVTVAVATVILVAAATGIGAAQQAPAVCDHDVGALVEAYNANVDAVPGVVRGVVADETVHVTVADDPNREYTAVTDADGRVTDFRAGAPASPTVRVGTDCGTVEAVVTADDPVAAFQAAYDGGDVTVRGVGPVRSVAVEVVEALVGLARTLGLL